MAVSDQPQRQFLYITPYFPPQKRVGALRPLKFVRHLTAQGWQPIVLADLRPEDDVDRALLDACPSDIIVSRTYARDNGLSIPAPREDEPKPASPQRAQSAWRRRIATFDDYASRQRWYPGPEWLPLGRHSLDIPHALRAARKLLQQYPSCEAIMVNADPYASLIVGAYLSRDSGLPLISDLRDPWAPCELRRPQRPALQRKLVDRMERYIIERSAKVILNTERTLSDYRAWYTDITPDRFTCIRNHADAELIAQGNFPPAPDDVCRLLFLGNLRRFVEGDNLLEALALAMRRTGDHPRPFELMISGKITPEARRKAEELGIAQHLVAHPFVPYTQVGSFMNSAHGLIALNNATVQRIPAKLYDYLTSDKPIVVIADNPEIETMVAPYPGLTLLGLSDIAGLAQAMIDIRNAGAISIPRELGALSSESASERLAKLLCEVCSPSNSMSQAIP